MEQVAKPPSLPPFLRRARKGTKLEARDRLRRDIERTNCSLSLMLDGNLDNVSFELMPVVRDRYTGLMKGMLVKDPKRNTGLLLRWDEMESLCTEQSEHPMSMDTRYVQSSFNVHKAVPPTPFPEDILNPFHLEKPWCPEPMEEEDGKSKKKKREDEGWADGRQRFDRQDI